MNKLGIIFILIFNFCCSQTNYTLQLKFDEKFFLSNFITNKTNNPFILKVFKESDSISDFDKRKTYIEILDSRLKSNLSFSEEEEKKLSIKEKEEFDSLKVGIENGSFLKLFKKAVEANFSTEFLEESLSNNGVENYRIISKDYNQFLISFSDKTNWEKTRILFSKNKLSFHEELSNQELTKIQNCFMKENDMMVKNNYLKQENNYLLVYKDDVNLFGDSYHQSKCLDLGKVTFLIDKGEESDVFSKLFFVKATGKTENNLVNSIVAYDFESEKNKDSDGMHVFITLLLNKEGQNFLSKFSELNIGKNVFLGNTSEFLMSPYISEKLNNGKILLKVNILEGNWQKTFELIRFEAFRNSVIIQ